MPLSRVTRPLARPTSAWHEWRWGLLAVVVSLFPVSNVFTLSRIFYVRDLTLAFRPRFLFLRWCITSGTLPLWDPYPANGQTPISDALYQLFHFPSLAIRLLLPEVIAFNTWVALPVPLAAAGAYLYLRRHVAAPAAAFGAIVFAVAGPTVSTTNFPNLSWSVACVPFVLWALDRLAERGRAADGALVAVIVSAQALAGEPVTLAATLLVAAAYVAWPLGGLRNWRLLAMSAAALLLGVLLAGIQFLPLAKAGQASVRGMMEPDDFWAFHPLAMIELVAPHFFGDYFNSNLAELQWMVALNSGREPFYYTMYMGVPALLAAGVAAFSGRRRTTFWAIVVVAFAVASLGGHTPLYPALQWAVPGLRAFRFPVKYLSVVAIGVATLAAFTCDWMMKESVPARPRRVLIVVALVLAALAYAFIGWQLVAPRTPIYLTFKLAGYAHVRSPIQAAEFLIYRARPLLTVLFLKVVCGTFLLAVASSRRPERRLAFAVLWGFGTIDLLAANSSVNPTMALSQLHTPAWVSRLPPDLHERVYVGGRIDGYVQVTDEDAPKYIADIPGTSQMEQRFVTVNEMAFYPSGWKIREALTYDLPLLWPVLHTKTVNRFRTAPREDRMRFLKRVGTRFFILPAPAPPGVEPLASLRGVEQLKLYDVYPEVRRAYVVPDALIGKDPDWAVEGLFQPRFDPAAGVLVSEPLPPAAGFPGPGVRPEATFLEDGVNRVVIRAGLPADGYLALLDSYDPDWHVEVDGVAAPLIRANGLFRAVHLASGQHTVTFTYRPRILYTGAAVTAGAALMLSLWCAVDVRRRRRATLADLHAATA
jgi:Bacterial membrane protein YfhO